MIIEYNHAGREDAGTIKPEAQREYGTVEDFDASEVYDETGTAVTDRKSYETTLDEVTERLGVDKIETSEEPSIYEETVSEAYDAASRATTAVKCNGYKIGGVKETAKKLGIDIIDDNTPKGTAESRRASLNSKTSSSLEETFSRSDSVWGQVRSFLS